MAIRTALSKIEREIGVRRCLIIDGNVADIYNTSQGLVSLSKHLVDKLKTMGYETYTWNRVDGLCGDVSRLRLLEESNGETHSEQGEVYDCGDENESVVEDGLPKLKDIKGVSELIRINFTNKNASKYAFVIDWVDFLWSNSQNLGDEEREALTILSKAIKETSSTADLKPSDNVIVFICKDLGLFPLSFYQRNPDIVCITISKPDRIERREIIDLYRHCINIKDRDKRKEEQADMLDGFTNREILQLIMMSHKDKDKLTFEKLFTMFKYGEKENPWETLSVKRLKEIKEELSSRVVGQERAIDKIERVVIKAFMGLTGVHKTSSRQSPKGALFFVGPTGVGKTELCKSLANFLFGDEQACIRFDMSEYAQENSDQKLIGAPPGFVGYEEGGQLTNAIRERPFSIVLFDEIEKAAKPNPRILDIFLQILEDGRLTDSRGETVYFSETIIVFTSNLGAAEITPTNTDETVARLFIDKVKNYFDNEIGRPELLGRIGYSNIVPFNFIRDEEFRRKIARSKLRPVQNLIKDKYKLNLVFDNEDEFISLVVGDADKSKGGRDILNQLNDVLLDKLAMFLFDEKENLRDYEGMDLRVAVKNKELHFDFQ